MRALISLTLVVMLAIGIAGCAKKSDDGKIPITTTSDDAKKEFLAGRSLVDKILYTNAIQHFDKAIALDSGFARAYLERANASFTNKDFFFYLMKAITLKDRCTEGERLLIFAAEAGANANTVKQKEYLDSLITLFPNDERVHLSLGYYYQGQQELALALGQFRKAVDIEPGYSTAYNALGYAYRQIENFPEAENAFKKYIELVPGDPNPYDSYAELLLKLGRFDESISQYQRALKADQNFFNAHIGIAANYMYKGELESAARELTSVYDLARSDGERQQVNYAQIVLYVDAGKMDLALQEVEKRYLLHEKSNDVVSLANDLGMKGDIFLEVGRYADALAAYEKSEQLIASSDLSQEQKDNARLNLHFERAGTALESKDLKKAKAEAEEFRSTTEQKKNLTYTMMAHQLAGRIAFAEKKYETAVAELLKTSQQNPRNLYRLALAYQAMGQKVKAKDFYTRAAKFNSMPTMTYAFIRMKAEKLLSTM